MKPPKQPKPAPPALPPRRIPVEPLLVLGLFLAFWAIYYLSIGVEKPNLNWPNFVFDADPARVLDDALTGQNPVVFARHPLFALIVETLSRLFGAVLDPRSGVLAATSCLAALGVAASLLLFRRICGQQLPALCFALLYGFTSTCLVLAAIPETFAINSALIVGVFLLHRPEFAQPLRHGLRFFLNALLAALALGVAVPNIVYPALGFASNLRAAQTTLRARAAVLLGFVAATSVILVVLGWAQHAAFPSKVAQGQVLTAPFKAVGEDSYLRFDRKFVPAEAARLLRAFTADNVVAPPALIATERVPDGPLSLIQYGGPLSPLYLLAVLALVALVGTLLWRGNPGEVLRDPTAQLALAFFAYNLGFHYFYRANGQPFIFAVHAVVPVLVVLAHLYRSSTFRFRIGVLAAAVLLVTLNNLSFLRFVDRAVELPCEQQAGSVCLAWQGHAEDPRFNRGVAQFMGSSDYPFELGHVEYAVGRFESSIPYFQKALALGDQYLLTRLYLGAALIRTGRLDEAIEHLTRALEQYPADPKLVALLEEAQRRRALAPAR